jgi:hypothetical protein
MLLAVPQAFRIAPSPATLPRVRLGWFRYRYVCADAGVDGNGAAVAVASGTSSFSDCIFTTNSAARTFGLVRHRWMRVDEGIDIGGAIWVNGGTPSFLGCTVTSNTAASAFCSPVNRNGCVFRECQILVVLALSPVALQAFQTVCLSATLPRVRIFACHTDLYSCGFHWEIGTGGAIWVQSGTPSFSNCTFTSNSASMCWESHSYICTDAEIVTGGAVFVDNTGTPVFLSCNFGNNRGSAFVGGCSCFAFTYCQ